jgi:hypothetical protein
MTRDECEQVLGGVTGIMVAVQIAEEAAGCRLMPKFWMEHVGRRIKAKLSSPAMDQAVEAWGKRAQAVIEEGKA